MLSQLQDQAINGSRQGEDRLDSRPSHQPPELQPANPMVEESKEQGPPQSQIQRRPHTYDPYMPRLSSIAMMSHDEVFLWLKRLDASIYQGYEVKEILRHITLTEGQRYLSELALCNEQVKSKLDAILEASSQSAEQSPVPDVQRLLDFSKITANCDKNLNQQEDKAAEEKKDSNSNEKDPTAQPNTGLIKLIKRESVREITKVDSRAPDKSALPIANGGQNRENQRPDPSLRLQAQNKKALKKGPWETAVAIDHVSEGSDYDQNERLSEAQAAQCQIEAEQFLKKCGRAILSPSKSTEKKPVIEALALEGFLSNHRASGKQTKKTDKSDKSLNVVEFPAINKFQK